MEENQRWLSVASRTFQVLLCKYAIDFVDLLFVKWFCQADTYHTFSHGTLDILYAGRIISGLALGFTTMVVSMVSPYKSSSLYPNN